jgi:hypothetical protein
MPGESEKNDAKSGGKKRTSADKAVASQRVLEDGNEAPPAASASQVQEPNNSEATGTTNCTQLVMFKVRVCAYQFVTMTFASVSGAASMTLMANVGSANGGSANVGSANGGSANGGSANGGQRWLGQRWLGQRWLGQRAQGLSGLRKSLVIAAILT